MLKRFNDLSFVIGLFFLLVSVILLVNTFVNGVDAGKLNLYTGIVFFVFGVFMVTLKGKPSNNDQ